MKIITVTLSPAIDVHCQSDFFLAERENFAEITSRDAGGKGVNISRALKAFDIPNVAVVAVGEKNADSFLSSLCTDGINCEAIWTEGLIRENITIHPTGAKETRLSFSGFSGSDALVDDIEAHINGIADKGDVIAIAGSIPKGISIERVKALVMSFKAKGAKLVIDSRSFTASDVIECAPFLIKPNEQEIAAYTDRSVTTLEEAERAAEDIRQKGVENVMISLGSLGAVLASCDGIFSAKAPLITALSTIGAGDSSIAGFLAAYSEGKSYAECLKTAVAYGSAACLTEGTKPPRKEDIKNLLLKIGF
ncbi:MAG: 1-phosphofructokinase family hexose kinase [Clostridia bacterium]|nr:1-phosphofructokinase family hexose kinase [Clostridia bacterium]